MKHKPRFWASSALIVYMVALGVHATVRAPAARHIDAGNTKLVAWGERVYGERCAACHGARLEGQPGWQHIGADGRLPAPPHDERGHTWHHSDRYLIRVTTHGLIPGKDRPSDYRSGMPAFREALSDEEIVAVLSFIKSTWSYEYRAWQERAGESEHE
ncbi:c-type cytochrome [Ramlibacter sp.]|uniref:c-type cytochrome n=1 Tax=Ramlibacter sp. TaxID=1917967 RepID=UPI0025E6F617|nr:c-type cytochrome [Ramlibacter sp.]